MGEDRVTWMQNQWFNVKNDNWNKKLHKRSYELSEEEGGGGETTYPEDSNQQFSIGRAASICSICLSTWRSSRSRQDAWIPIKLED